MREALKLRSAVLFLLAAAAVSCSLAGSSKTYRDKSASLEGRKTWAWLESKGDQPSPDWDKRIRSGIAARLSALGLRRAEGGAPDLYVAYHIAIDESLVTDEKSLGYDWAKDAGVSGPSKISRGTLLIDLVDPPAKRLLFRGEATTDVNRKSDAEDKLHALDTAIEQIFSELHPGR